MRVKMLAGSGEMGSCRIPRGTASGKGLHRLSRRLCDVHSTSGGSFAHVRGVGKPASTV